MYPRTLAIAVMGMLTVASQGLAAPSSSETVTPAKTTTCKVLNFDTDQHRFRAGRDNQGYVVLYVDGYALVPGSGYTVGLDGADAAIFRDWFTFALAGLPTGSVTKASLVVRNDHTVIGNGGHLRFHKVTTRPKPLNTGTADPESVYDDLADGRVYANKYVTPDMLAPDRLVIPLNSAGVAAVNAAAGHLISFGGTVDPDPPGEDGDVIWWDSSMIGRQRLSVTSCT